MAWRLELEKLYLAYIYIVVTIVLRYVSHIWFHSSNNLETWWLLLNLYWLLKNSNVKQSIFEEVQQQAYNLSSLKLIKAAITRWLSLGQAGQRVLDRYKAFVAALDAIYLCKREPAVRGLHDNLIKPITIAILCILRDVLLMTNSMQRLFQSSRLNFVEKYQKKKKNWLKN